MHEFRSGVTHTLPPREDLPTSMITLPEVLKTAGYKTSFIGKWHLGRTPGRFPTDQGFDEWYGVPNSTDESVYSSMQGFAESPWLKILSLKF